MCRVRAVVPFGMFMIYFPSISLVTRRRFTFNPFSSAGLLGTVRGRQRVLNHTVPFKEIVHPNMYSTAQTFRVIFILEINTFTSQGCTKCI